MTRKHFAFCAKSYIGVKMLAEYIDNGSLEEESIDTGTITVSIDNVETYKN